MVSSSKSEHWISLIVPARGVSHVIIQLFFYFKVTPRCSSTFDIQLPSIGFDYFFGESRDQAIYEE